MLLCSEAALADGLPDTFATAAVTLLDRELPQMDNAVGAKDRAYFAAAVERMDAFIHVWEAREGPAVLDRYPACTNAVTDFLFVGLCKISPPGSICEPATFFPRVEHSIEQCRALVSVLNAPQK
jgi:hypothetical protein